MKLFHSLQEFITYLYVAILSCIPISRHYHVLSFLSCLLILIYLLSNLPNSPERYNLPFNVSINGGRVRTDYMEVLRVLHVKTGALTSCYLLVLFAFVQHTACTLDVTTLPNGVKQFTAVLHLLTNAIRCPKLTGQKRNPGYTLMRNTCKFHFILFPFECTHERANKTNGHINDACAGF